MAISELQDVLYEVDNGLAWITINRPNRYNGFRGRISTYVVQSLTSQVLNQLRRGCSGQGGSTDPCLGFLGTTALPAHRPLIL